jgi:hypothetical protein
MPGTIAIFVSFVWLFVNLVDVAGSLIVLLNRDGYQRASFVIADIDYQHRRKTGLFWGFTGKVAGVSERYYAPTLVEEKKPSLSKLRRLFPVKKEMDVLYNPEVTDTLYQRRTLNVLPYAPDFVAVELERLAWFAKFCLLPFGLALIFDYFWRRRQKAGDEK